jgi:hypothetical protein
MLTRNHPSITLRYTKAESSRNAKMNGTDGRLKVFSGFFGGHRRAMLSERKEIGG